MPTKILLTSILTNVALTILKIVGGVLAGSAGLVADGFHSLTDCIAMTINYFGLRISLRPANGLEAYENYKKEIIGTFVVAAALFVIGLFLLVKGYVKLTIGAAHAPGLGAALIVVVSFVITIWLYKFVKKLSQDFDSPGLDINTEQIRLNILSTVAVLIGIAGGLFGMNFLDPVAAIVVSLIIIYSSVEIIFKFMKETEMARLSHEQVEELEARIEKIAPGVKITRIKTMVIRRKIWLFLELVDTPEKPVSHSLIASLKLGLLSETLYLSNVIVAAAPPEATFPRKVEIEDFGRELGAARNYLSLAGILGLICIVSFSAFGVPFGSREYRVLVPSMSMDIDGVVSTDLGRAPYFYIYRLDKNRGQFVENRMAAHPLDIDKLAVKFFKDYCIEAVIAENVGPHIFEQLNQAGVVFYESHSLRTVHQQIDALAAGELDEITAPNVDVRFGIKNMRLLEPWYNWEAAK